VKAVVLARGKVTRMQRLDETAVVDSDQAKVAATGLKAMIPFRRPFLDYVLSALADAGCTAVCLVIGPEHEMVRDYYERTRPPQRLRVAFAIQAEPRGTADAVLAAEPFAGSDPFLVLNADNYYPVEVCRALVALNGPGLPAFGRKALVEQSNIDPERIRSFAMLTIGEDGMLQDIVEKPDPGTFARLQDVRVSMNCWRFAPSIFEACRKVEVSARGEVELPNAVRLAIKVMGERMQTIPVDVGVLDLSRREDIAEVEQRLAGIDPHP
jgi:glucose-1-phosphate thymidylyltransferase